MYYVEATVARKDGYGVAITKRFPNCQEMGYWLDEHFYNSEDYVVTLTFGDSDA